MGVGSISSDMGQREGRNKLGRRNSNVNFFS